jgi:hypothetical protein
MSALQLWLHAWFSIACLWLADGSRLRGSWRMVSHAVMGCILLCLALPPSRCFGDTYSLELVEM